MYYIRYAIRYINKRFIRKIIKYIFISCFIFLISSNVNAKTLTSISVESDQTYNNSYMYNNNSTTKFIGYLGSRVNTNSHVLLFSFYNTNTIKANTTFTLSVRGNDDFFPASVTNASKGACYSLTQRNTFDCGGGQGWAAYVSGFSVSNNNQYGFDLTFTSREESKFIVISLSVPTGQLLTGYDYFTINSATLTFNENQELSAIEEKLTTIESKQNQILSKQQEIQDKADDINDTLNDSDIDIDHGGGGALFDKDVDVDSNGVLTQIILFPLTLLQRILAFLSPLDIAGTGYCPSLDLGALPFTNTHLVLPCFESMIIEPLGTAAYTLWYAIGAIASAFMLYRYFFYIRADLESITELKEVEIKEW